MQESKRKRRAARCDWDARMNDRQKNVMRCMTDDDRASTTTLRCRLNEIITRKDMMGLKRRGLVVEPDRSARNVWVLTDKGRIVAKAARNEIEWSYADARQAERRAIERARNQPAKRSQYLPPVSSIVSMKPAALAAYLKGEEPTDQPAAGTSPSTHTRGELPGVDTVQTA